MPSRHHTAAILVSLAVLLSGATATAETGNDTPTPSKIQHTLGAAAGSALYHTHLFIGTAIVAYQAKALTGEQVRVTVRSSARVTQNLIDSLVRAKTAEMPADDKARLDELVAIAQLVLGEARQLLNLVQSGSEDDAKAFAEQHQSVRYRLGKLLGL